MSRGEALDWAIRGVGVLERDRRMKDVMDAQDGLYTLIVKHPDGTLDPTVMGAIVGYELAVDDAEAVIEAMAAASTRIVSLVTEALRRRRDRGLRAFTVMSMDNLEGNGHLARRVHRVRAPARRRARR